MGVITNNWNDGSGDSITIESPSFKGNQSITISSPVQKDTVKRSMVFIGKCKNDSTKTVKLIIEQAASQYTYDLILNTDSSTIAASGGTVTITGTLKTYRNGELVNTETVIPKLSGSSIGFSISNNKVTAASRGTTVGETRSISITGSYNNTYDGQTVQSSIVIAQAANEISYGNVSISGGTVSDIPASGGSISSASGISTSQTVSYTSGSTRAGSVTISYSSAVTAKSKGTTISNKTSVGTLTAIATGEGSKSASKSFTVYQAANVKTQTGITINKDQPDDSWISVNSWDSAPAKKCYLAIQGFKTYKFTSGENSSEPINNAHNITDIVVNLDVSWAKEYKSLTRGHSVVLDSRGTTVGEVRTGNVSWTYGEFTSNTLSFTQVANTLTWTTPIISRTTPVSIAATGGTDNITTGLTYSQKGTYSSGSTTSANSGGTLSYTVQTAKTGFSLSGSTVTVTNNTSLSARNGFIVRITLALNGKTAIKDIIYNQAAGYYTYANPVVTVKCNDVPASGGSVTSGTVTYSQTYGWNGAISGAGTVTSGGSISWSGGASNIPSLGTTVKSRSIVGSKLVAVVTLNSKTGTGSIDVYQAANSITNYEYGNWIISISANPTTISAAGGTSIITRSCKRSKTPVYTSGSKGSTITESATPTLSISGTGFTLNGTTVTASKNNTAQRTAIVTASYSGATSKSVTITQKAGTNGIGYMQIEGNGIDHYIFKVG